MVSILGDIGLKEAISIILLNHHHMKPFFGVLFQITNNRAPLAMSKPIKHLCTSTRLKNNSPENQRLGSGRELHEDITVKGNNLPHLITENFPVNLRSLTKINKK